MEKLYKSLLSLIIVFSLSLFFGNTSRAAMSLQEFKDKITNEAHFTIPSGHDQFLQNVLDAWQGNEFDLYVANDRNRWLYFFGSYSNNVTVEGNSIKFIHPCLYRYLWEYNGNWTEYNYDSNYVSSDYTQSPSSYNYFVNFGSGITIDFDNIYYSPNIPIPDMDVYYVLSSSSGGSGVAVWNAEMNIEDNSDFYIQYGYKITVPTYVGVGLDSSTGQYTYSYDQYSEGNYVDFVTIQDMQQCVNISFGSNEMTTAWQDAYDLLVESIPEFYAKIPFWVQNPNAAKYVDAQNYYKNYMMTQLPMFGNRLELFARYFIVNEDNQVVVGDWLHWSSRTGSRTQEKPSNYIDNVQLPGFVNTSNNVTLETEDNTFQQSGESVGAATVINNNYAPNYPDYPTIASYNKDNLLLETMGYMSNMNNFLSGPQGFGHFLTEVFTFIPSYVWGMVAMGFGVAIIVMFIKML